MYRGTGRLLSGLRAAAAAPRVRLQSGQAAQVAAATQDKHFLLQRSNKEELAAIRAAWPKPEFSIKALKDLLDHDNIEMRDQFREFLKQDLYKPRYNLTLDEERELALKRLQAICDAGFISVLDFVNNPLKIFAAHELAVIDPGKSASFQSPPCMLIAAMGTKMTVQFNLFGGTVLKLGSERHNVSTCSTDLSLNFISY